MSDQSGSTTHEPCRAEELRGVDLFANLPLAQLQLLCARGHTELFPPGPLCREGQLAEFFYVLLDGELVVAKRLGGEDIDVERTSRRGRSFGALVAPTDAAEHRYDFSVRLTRPSRVFVMTAADFTKFMRSECAMAAHLLEGYLADAQQQRRALGQRDMLLALGALTAGINLQLEKPAHAIARAVTNLRTSSGTTRIALASLLDLQINEQVLRVLITFEDEVVEQVAKSHAQARQVDGEAYIAPLTDAETAQRVDDVVGWMHRHGVNHPRPRATALVTAGLDVGWLDRLQAGLEGVGARYSVDVVVGWLEQTVDTEVRMQEIAEACARISALVDGAKLYSHMDRGEYQSADLHELLRGTMVMYGDRIAMPGKGRPITLAKHLDETIPEIHCYPGDLNQVWTNIIDNAVRAMHGRGTLTLRTWWDGVSSVCVEIGDDGPGIPAHIIDRIFEPFFTTQPAGRGAGLGLAAARQIVVDKHYGTLSVRSDPGDTRFTVCLPVRAPSPGRIADIGS